MKMQELHPRTRPQVMKMKAEAEMGRKLKKDKRVFFFDFFLTDSFPLRTGIHCLYL